MLKIAQNKFDFYETPKHHGKFIFNDHAPKYKLKVIDICCGLGSLIQPWYDDGHDITLVELNDDFIDILKIKYPSANIINIDFLSCHLIDSYDVYLCNPPFNTSHEKQIYTSFFCKILNHMRYGSTLYFIAPRMFYKNQMKIKIESEFKDYVNNNNEMSAKYFFDRYGFIELDSDGFRFNHTMIKRIKLKGIIDDDFFDDDFMIQPYFEFRYLKNIFDFKETSTECGLFKVNK